MRRQRNGVSADGQVGTSLLIKLCLNVITNAIIVNITMLTVNVIGEDSKVFTVNDTKTPQAHLYGNYCHILINASKVTNRHPGYVISEFLGPVTQSSAEDLLSSEIHFSFWYKLMKGLSEVTLIVRSCLST